MTSPASSLKLLATRKAALTRHHGPDDPKTLEAAAALRTALLGLAIMKAKDTRPAMTDGEREFLRMLLSV